MPKKSRSRRRTRRKRGSSVLGGVWDYGVVNPVSNWVVKPVEYGVGAVIPGSVGRELQSRGKTHREPGMYGKRGSFFGGKRRRKSRRKSKKSRKSRKKKRRSRKRRRR